MEDFKLKIFTVLCRTGSFTAAASELGISQPAVSQNIKDLESMLGTSLFVRSYGRMEITPAGKVLQHYAGRILGEYSALTAAFTPVPAGEDKLNIYMPAVSRELFSADLLSVLKILRPGLDVTIVDDMGEADINLIEMLDKRKKDTGIVIDVHVFPLAHPMSGLVSQAIELVRYSNVLSD